MRFALKAWLFAACAIAGFGCTDGAKTQVLTGRLTTRDAVAVRAIDGTTIITAARVRSDGRFTLLLPAHHRYRLEVLTPSGVHNLIGAKDGSYTDVTFAVCQPQDPFDMGGMCDPNDPTQQNCQPDGVPGCDPMTDPNCTWCNDPTDPNCGGGTCDPSTDPNCGWMCPDPTDPNCGKCDPMTDPSCAPPPPCDPNTNSMCVPCDPSTDPNCGWMCPDPTDPNCGKCDPMTDPNCLPPPPPCDPMTDPNCNGQCMSSTDPNCSPPCDPMTDPNCVPPPPPCDPSTDPMCKCYPGDPNCPAGCDPLTDPNCDGTCDPSTNAMCPTPPPPCTDPMDPNTCKDPCVVDPLACGCGMAGDPDPNNGTTMPDGSTCWPPPEPCMMGQCPDEPWWPEHPPGDFGCGDDNGTTMPTMPDNTMPGDGTK